MNHSFTILVFKMHVVNKVRNDIQIQNLISHANHLYNAIYIFFMSV